MQRLADGSVVAVLGVGDDGGQGQTSRAQSVTIEPKVTATVKL